MLACYGLSVGARGHAPCDPRSQRELRGSLYVSKLNAAASTAFSKLNPASASWNNSLPSACLSAPPSAARRRSNPRHPRLLLRLALLPLRGVAAAHCTFTNTRADLYLRLTVSRNGAISVRLLDYPRHPSTPTGDHCAVPHVHSTYTCTRTCAKPRPPRGSAAAECYSSLS